MFLIKTKRIIMPVNAYMYLVAGLIPLIVGAAYYSPMLLEGAWMRSNKFTKKDIEGGNMALIFGLAYLFSVILAFGLTNFVVHQTSVFQLLIPEVFEAGSETERYFADFIAKYGDKHRSFGHGALHGGLLSVIVALPLIAINALFERRGWQYVMIHFGYWFITLILMGGLLCYTLKW